MDENKPILSPPEAVRFKLPEQEKSDWRPKAMVHSDKVVRIQEMQTRILKTIKEKPLPPDECLAALGGAMIWLLGMNLPTLKLCQNYLRDLKDQLKIGMERQWPVCNTLREDMLRRMIGETQQIPSETDSGDGSSPTQTPPEDVPGSERPDVDSPGKIPDVGPNDQ